MRVTTGYQALKERTAWVDVSDRGRIRVTGDDRARLIHALTTNHVQQMKPQDQVYAFFLTAQGRIVSDSYITCYEDHLLLDVEADAREAIINHIDHYIIADDVTLADITAETFSMIASENRIYGPIGGKQAFIDGTASIPASTEDFEAYRIEQFHPVFGKDFNSSTLPQETGLTYALHFNKGCYLGQEIVERIRSRGHVNKMLVGLRAAPGDTFVSGGKVTFNGEDAGQITSWANNSAVAMVRTSATKPGTIVQASGISVEVNAVS